MPLTDDELQALHEATNAAYGEPGGWKSLVPWLNELSEGELWALAGMFSRYPVMENEAWALGDYASHVRDSEHAGGVRCDARIFMARWEAQQHCEAETEPCMCRLCEGLGGEDL